MQQEFEIKQRRRNSKSDEILFNENEKTFFLESNNNNDNDDDDEIEQSTTNEIIDTKISNSYKTSMTSVLSKLRLNYSLTDQNLLNINDSVITCTTNKPANLNRPKVTNCSQQNLIAWKPLLTPKFVINLFLINSFLFLPIGIILLYNSNNIYEFRHDYTDCNDKTSLNETCHSKMIKNSSYKCVCRVYFYEDRFQDETLHVYYMLENYYQNIRQYVRSLDSYQLLNKYAKQNELAYECEPFRYKIDKEKNFKLKYSPCGAIANSLFNDTFTIYYLNNITNQSIKLNISKTNLAWDCDRDFKFSNYTDNLNTIKPPNWNKNISELDSGLRNEDLMVWMRTAAFPSFRKLYGRILLEQNLRLGHNLDKYNRTFHKLLKQYEKNESLIWKIDQKSLHLKIAQHLENKTDLKTMRLPKGHYYIDIDYRYMVKQFNGRKYFILANVSWLGGKSYFMAWAYIIVGLLCFIASLLLFFLHVYYGNMHYNTAILLVDVNTRLVK